MLHCIILCAKAFCLDGKILHSLKIGCHSIHKDLRILKLREGICDRLVDQAACRDHSKSALC